MNNVVNFFSSNAIGHVAKVLLVLESHSIALCWIIIFISLGIILVLHVLLVSRIVKVAHIRIICYYLK